MGRSEALHEATEALLVQEFECFVLHPFEVDLSTDRCRTVQSQRCKIASYLTSYHFHVLPPTTSSSTQRGSLFALKDKVLVEAHRAAFLGYRLMRSGKH
jgi:hypothetical protein